MRYILKLQILVEKKKTCPERPREDKTFQKIFLRYSFQVTVFRVSQKKFKPVAENDLGLNIVLLRI